MPGKLRVVQYGIGPIGMKTTELLVEREALEIVGAVDRDPDKIGCDLGELAGLATPLGVRVSSGGVEDLRRLKADAVILTTSSSLEQIRPQILEIVFSGANVVSSCEELVFPWLTRPDIAREIDEAARENNVSVLATGVNPGFLMDFLPVAMTGICREVKSVTVERVQDAQFRRLPFREKIGAGLTLKDMDARVKAGVLRHVGLTESIHLIAASLGWKLDKTEESLSPVVAKTRLVTAEMTIERGRASGVRQIGRGFSGGESVIDLVFQATVGEPEPRDRILIRGTPNIDLVISHGINGDIATCAILVNAVPVVMKAVPGLRTMVDVGAIPCMG
jgi:2,4-diaminopentanoate dehydrogenase